MKTVLVGVWSFGLGVSLMAMHEKQSVTSLGNTCVAGINQVRENSVAQIQEVTRHADAKIHELRDYCISLVHSGGKP